MRNFLDDFSSSKGWRKMKKINPKILNIFQQEVVNNKVWLLILKLNF